MQQNLYINLQVNITNAAHTYRASLSNLNVKFGNCKMRLLGIPTSYFYIYNSTKLSTLSDITR